MSTAHGKFQRGFAGIGLVASKTEANVGGALRAALCYQASMVVLQAPRYDHCPTNTMRTERHVPMFVGDILDHRPYGCELVVVELIDGAISLPAFQHPQRALYVFGPEDGNVPKRLVDAAQHVVQVPTRMCMNLAATVNVVLYDRAAKFDRYEKGIRNADLVAAHA